MTRILAVSLALIATPAFASHHVRTPSHVTCDHLGCRAEKTAKLEQGVKVKTRVHRISNPMGRPHFRIIASSDPRPRAWCGWWMRHYLGVTDRALNRAIAWAHYGTPAHGPHIGVIVVWPHHVGIITGKNRRAWIVKSGNDGHAVRERGRSLAGAVAFRWPNGVALR